MAKRAQQVATVLSVGVFASASIRADQNNLRLLAPSAGKLVGFESPGPAQFGMVQPKVRAAVHSWVIQRRSSAFTRLVLHALGCAGGAENPGFAGPSPSGCHVLIIA